MKAQKIISIILIVGFLIAGGVAYGRRASHYNNAVSNAFSYISYKISNLKNPTTRKFPDEATVRNSTITAQCSTGFVPEEWSVSYEVILSGNGAVDYSGRKAGKPFRGNIQIPEPKYTQLLQNAYDDGVFALANIKTNEFIADAGWCGLVFVIGDETIEINSSDLNSSSNDRYTKELDKYIEKIEYAIQLDSLIANSAN